MPKDPNYCFIVPCKTAKELGTEPEFVHYWIDNDGIIHMDVGNGKDAGQNG